EADDDSDDESVSGGGFPPSASLCSKCNTKALVLMDNCQTCLNCGYSKCG
ncbi:MAG: NrdJb, partial [Oleiagrimonas sp.]|nr:NrdJb [Oleiagrimonas sp.]